MTRAPRAHYEHFYPTVASRVPHLEHALETVTRRVLDDVWVRDLPARFLRKKDGSITTRLLEPVGYRYVHNRYTRHDAFPSLYLADGSDTALAEVFGTAARVKRRGVPAQNRLQLRVTVHAPGIVDLTDADVRIALSLDRAEITMVANHFDLDAFNRPFAYELPQCVGELANALGVGGLLYPSAPDTDGTCLVLFTDQLAAHGGWYEAEHPVTGDVERWPA